MDAWISRVRIVLLMVRSMCSALPFCSEVYGHERTKSNAMAREEGCGGIVDEFRVVIGLETLWHDVELSVNIGQ